MVRRSCSSYRGAPGAGGRGDEEGERQPREDSVSTNPTPSGRRCGPRLWRGDEVATEQQKAAIEPVVLAPPRSRHSSSSCCRPMTCRRPPPDSCWKTSTRFVNWLFWNCSASISWVIVRNCCSRSRSAPCCGWHCGVAGRARWYIWPCKKVSPCARRRSPPTPHPHRKVRPFIVKMSAKDVLGSPH